MQEKYFEFYDAHHRLVKGTAMTKFTVTKELSILIKILRIQSKIQSKSLALHIGKSISYVSKLESGMIKTIQEKELTDILSYLTEGQDFFSDKFPVIMQTLSSFAGPEAVTRQIWLFHYDGFLRPVMLPERMIDDMAERLRILRTTPEELAAYINSDVDFPFLKKLPVNQLIECNYHGKNGLFIHVRIEEKELSALLHKENFVTNSSNIFRVVFAVFRKERFHDMPLTDEMTRIILEETVSYLEKYRINALTVVHNLVSPQGMHADLRIMQAEYATETSGDIAQIMQALLHSAELKSIETADALTTLKHNLEWDPAFTLKILELAFYQLGPTSFHIKKQILNDMNTLLDKYQKIPGHERKLENY